MHYSRAQLRTMVRRLLSAGMSAEQVKEWFVAEIPNAMMYAASLGLRARGSRRHTVHAQRQQAT